MDYSFWNNNNSKLNKINLKTGKSWSDITKKADNTGLNSIWQLIDNGDGIVQQQELDLLNKLLKAADNSNTKTKGNGIIENEELTIIKNKINDGSIKEDLDTRPFGTVDGKNANLKNFSYIDNQANLSDKNLTAAQQRRLQRNVKNQPIVVNVDYSQINIEQSGEYYIEKYNRVKNEDGTYTETPVINKKMDSGQGRGTSWSEGLDRKIGKISISAQPDNNWTESMSVLRDELSEIGKEVGFEVEEINTGNGVWIEDYGIRRADGKVGVISESTADNIKTNLNNKNRLKEITNNRREISVTTQGKTAEFADVFRNNVRNDDLVDITSYLEGGNVLNTTLADGTPGAIIGQESINYTLMALGLENNEENIKTAKNQIAQDLGLKPENITYIPQFDFHIDMSYRPLGNGEIAVPDYEEGVKLLKETEIKGMDEKSKQELITKLEEFSAKSADIREDAINTLSGKGYKIVKIPSFSTDSESEINFMNGVGGTSKTGSRFYITNNSGYPELNEAVQKYFQNAGVDKMYFVSTKAFLSKYGGIDCLTQEV